MNSQNNRVPVLMYHEVSIKDESRNRIRRVYPGYVLSVPQFEQQMKYLYENEYRTLTLDDLFRNEYRDDKRVVITFDDGFMGNFTYAFPILKEYNFRATIFIIVNQVASAHYLNWDQLKEIQRHGFSIQSHTMTHRPLEELTSEEVFYELSMSKKIIEEKLEQPVQYLSLPHGSFHPNLLQIAREIGYTGICTSTFGYVTPENIQFTIGRIPIKRNHQIEDFQKIILEDHRLLLKYKIFLAITNGLSRTLGLQNYSRIYRFLFRIKPEC